MKITFAILKDLLAEQNIETHYLVNQSFYSLEPVTEWPKSITADTLYLIKANDYYPDSKNPSHIYAVIGTPEETNEIPLDNEMFLINSVEPQNDIHIIQSCLSTFFRWNDRLQNTSFNNHSLFRILDIGYEIIQNPMMLSDLSFKILAYTTLATSLNEIWDNSVSKGYIFVEGEGFDELQEIKPLVHQGLKKPHIFQIRYTQNSVAMLNIFIERKSFACLSIIDTNHPITQGQLDLMEIVGQYISVCTRTIEYTAYYQSQGASTILYELLNNKEIDITSIHQRASYLNWTLNTTKQLAIIRPIEDCKYYTSISLLLEQIMRYLPQCIGVIYHEQIVILMTEKAVLNAGSLKKFLEEAQLIMGISSPFSDLLQCRKLYQNTVQVLYLKERFQLKGTFFYYENYRFLKIYDLFLQNGELKDYCMPEVFKLIEMDKEFHTDLFPTLVSYIRHGGKMVATSNELFIHRSTLSYRLRRIEDLLQVSLDDPDVFLDFSFTIKMISYNNIFKQT